MKFWGLLTSPVARLRGFGTLLFYDPTFPVSPPWLPRLLQAVAVPSDVRRPDSWPPSLGSGAGGCLCG